MKNKRFKLWHHFPSNLSLGLTEMIFCTLFSEEIIFEEAQYAAESGSIVLNNGRLLDNECTPPGSRFIYKLLRW